MNLLKKMLTALTSQVKQSSVTLPATQNIPHKITDDNQSIHNGVIHEKLDLSLRGAGKTSTKHKRKNKPKR